MFDFRDLPVEDRRTTKNDEARRKIIAKSPTETSRKRYGNPSAWIFFTKTIFLTNFKWFSDSRRVEQFCSALLPLFIGKWGRRLPPSSPRWARLLPPDGTAFWWNFLEGPSGPDCYLYPPCLLNTPSAFFLLILFRNVMELYEFCNNTCFLSVMLQNLTNYVIIPFFGFQNVTELHELCNNASFWLPACYGTSWIMQRWVPSTSKWSNEGCIPINGWSPNEIKVWQQC